MNKSAPVTPRSLQNNNNKKSRIPLATAPPAPGSGNVVRGVTTFRQWADPPPPPSRSRTAERISNKEKRRTGSADPRFRRSLESTRTNIHKHTAPVIIVAETKKQSSSVCELTSNNDYKEKLNEFPPSHVFDTKEENLDFLNTPNSLNLEGNVDANEIKQHFIEQIPMRVQHMINPEFEFEHDSFGTINREEIFNNVLNEGQSLATTQTESKYSQTDMLYSKDFTSEINEIVPEPEPINSAESDDVIHYISSNYDKQSRYLDGIVLNRTRSISSVYELEPVVRAKNVYRRKLGSISRIFLQYNYWTYFEFWAAFTFFLLIILFGWFYLLPYLKDACLTWIYPEPPLTASDYIRKSISEIVSSAAKTVYGILTTPANRRLA